MSGAAPGFTQLTSESFRESTSHSGINRARTCARRGSDLETYEFMRVLGERSNRVNRLYYRWAKAHGFSYNVLAVLYVAYKDRASTQKVVCEEWSLPKQTVNSVCRDLCQRGCLRLERGETDGRETRLVLTEAGRKLAEPVVTELIDIETRILGNMGGDAAATLLALFQRFCDEAERLLSASVRENTPGAREGGE